MTTFVRVPAEDAEIYARYHAVYSAALNEEWDRPYNMQELGVVLFDGHEYARTVALLGLDESGEAVAAGAVRLTLKDNLGLGYLDVHVLPERRREGHGTALLEALIDIARQEDRTRVLAEATWDADQDGSGRSAFAEARGFRLDLADAHRVLRLPASLPEAPARDGYTMHTWRGSCPEEWVDQYANLLSLITQEAPSGDVDLENEFFDEKRVRLEEADLTKQDRVMQSTIALSPEGVVAGHTQLCFSTVDLIDVFQWDTLVLPDHRGHGLGLSLKVHTMDAATDLIAGRRFIHTYNAASNQHMIAVNEQMGFGLVGYLGEFVRDI